MIIFTQLYAMMTIENISSQGGYWSACFTSQDVITNICYIFRASGRQEITRLIAWSCLARLVRFSPSSIQSVKEKNDVVKLCLDALGMVVASTVPSLLDVLQQLANLLKLVEFPFQKISKMAHAHGAFMLVDNNIVSPVLFHPLELKA
ncbi:hypothetical protein H5410_036222, partial [Solanum commersonii]